MHTDLNSLNSALILKKSPRNGKIEVMRFLFAVIIMFCHSSHLFDEGKSPFLGGSLSVEFFCFVSGYLMMASVARKNERDPAKQIGKETAGFIYKKWSSVFPEALTAWIIAFGVMIAATQPKLIAIVSVFVDSVWELLLLSMTGLGKRGINSVVWYISAMLISMMILYPLLRKRYDFTLHIFIPFTCFVILGILYRNYGSLRSPTKWTGYTFKGVLRVYAEVGIGCLLFCLSEKCRSLSWNKFGRTIISLLENGIYVAVIGFMYFCDASKHDFFFAIILALAVSLSFSGVAIESGLYNNKFAYFLGKSSIPLYFSHIFWGSNLNAFLPADMQSNQKFVIYMAVSCVTAACVAGIAKLWRRVQPKVHNTLKLLFLSKI